MVHRHDTHQDGVRERDSLVQREASRTSIHPRPIDQERRQKRRKQPTEHVDPDRHPSVQIVESRGSASVLVGPLARLAAELLLRTESADRDDSVDGGGEVREEGGFGVGHFALDRELAVDVDFAEEGTDCSDDL